MDVLEEKDGKYYLTPAGREIAEHMQLVIPAFMRWVFAPETVSLFSIGAHVVLSLFKLGIGLFSRSAGLFCRRYRQRSRHALISVGMAWN